MPSFDIKMSHCNLLCKSIITLITLAASSLYLSFYIFTKSDKINTKSSIWLLKTESS